MTAHGHQVIGPVVVDLQALQSAMSRERGIGRYVLEWALSLERARPDLVGSYLLNSELPPPGSLDALVASGKVTYSRSRAFDSPARIWHICSPLDTSVSMRALWPLEARRNGLIVSMTVFDLIPAIDPEEHLADPVERRRYRTRLEFLRRAQQLYTLSNAVARDLSEIAHVGANRIRVVGAAPGGSFHPPRSKPTAQRSALDLLCDRGLRMPYVLCPSGSHPRKNNERLVEAWALLPEAERNTHQLVLTGEMAESTRHHLEVLAAANGCEGSVVLPSTVDDSTLVTLFQGATVVCVPSLAEGYGLPIVEAIACATAVIASDRPPFDELVGAHARFDPTSPAALAQTLSSALARPQDFIADAAHLTSWEEVARRSTEGFESLLGASSDRLRAPETRIAVVTPLPPAPTGVARYSYRLIEELARTGRCQIDVFVDGPVDDVLAPPGIRLFRVAALQQIEALRGEYASVIYVVGNSHHHLGALDMLQRRPGTVLAHDVRLTNLYRHAFGDPGLLRDRFQQFLHAMYGDGLPNQLGTDGFVSEEELERYGTYMARQVIGSSLEFLVSSQAAAALARIDAGETGASKIAVLAFAIEEPEALERDFFDEDTLQSATTLNDLPSDVAVIAHFGIVDHAKAPVALIEAFATAARHSPARLAFVGPIASAVAAELERAPADSLGVAEHVVFTGAVDSATYRSWLERATIAVQLRRSFGGEASAAIGECLACGLPTIVSDIGWCGELPDAVVSKVAVPLDVDRLAQQIISLVDDPGTRDDMATAARAYARTHRFTDTARELLDEVLRPELRLERPV